MKKIKIISEQDGLELSALLLEPQKPKGIIQISHVMAEHKERYIQFIEYLQKQGNIVIISDHRGHGQSVRKKEDLGYFYEKKADYIVEDLHQITLWIKEQYPNLPVILFGHSMGSMIVRKYIKKYDYEIDKLIVCGSPSKNSMANLGLFIDDILTCLYKDRHRSIFLQKLTFGSYPKKFNQKEGNGWLCTDEEIIKEYDCCKSCGFIFTLNGFHNLFYLVKDIYNKKNWINKNLNLPILFIAGEKDPVIGNPEKWRQSQQFLNTVGYSNIQSILYSNLRHEILNEPMKETIYKDIINWIQKLEVPMK